MRACDADDGLPPIDVEASFASALAHHEAGRITEAAPLYRAILACDPDHAESAHLLGLIVAGEGDLAESERLIRRAMRLAPGRAPHCNSLAGVLLRQGRGEAAIAAWHEALARRPNAPEIHNNLAAGLHRLGRVAEAIAAWRAAAALAPGIAEIWCNLAGALADTDDAEAEACFRRALTLRPDHADALAGLGRWLIAAGRWSEAEATLLAAIAARPDDARAWNNLGVTRQQLGHPTEAAAHYRQAAFLAADFADPRYNLGCLAAAEGDADAAVAWQRAALAANPGHGAARLALCMAELPILYRTEAEVTARRDRYLTALGALRAAVRAPAIAASVAAATGTSQPFFLPYQGCDDRAAQAEYGALVCRLLDDAEPKPPLASPPAAGERIRVGIVSGFFRDHTINRLFLRSWLTLLDRDRFTVTAFHTGRVWDAETERAAGHADRFVHSIGSAASWREAVAAAAPHVLLYPEIGMDPVAARLAAQRLAPLQCASWGQPVTTGMPSIDVFLSAELMEPCDGDAHYTERVARLPGLGVCYEPDARTPPECARAAFGLPSDVPVYWSGQALYKYHPRYDAVFPRIAATVGDCRFVFIAFAKSQAVTAVFQDRLRLAFAARGMDARRYCVMLPPMDQARFLTGVGVADVVLDTPGWSGGRSTLDCLTRDPAIVTLPGPFMRGRHTAAILRRIGCVETIAASLDDYVAIAARLGRDAAFRARVRRAVARRKHLAFHDVAPIRALEAFLVDEMARLARRSA